MDAQGVGVFVLVSACSLYALWVLVPAAARFGLAAWLLRLPGMRLTWRVRLAQVASTPSGCDCSGCDKAVDVQGQGRLRVIRIHNKPKA